jgi:hypothetical protein
LNIKSNIKPDLKKKFSFKSAELRQVQSAKIETLDDLPEDGDVGQNATPWSRKAFVINQFKLNLKSVSANKILSQKVKKKITL